MYVVEPTGSWRKLTRRYLNRIFHSNFRLHPSTPKWTKKSRCFFRRRSCFLQNFLLHLWLLPGICMERTILPTPRSSSIPRDHVLPSLISRGSHSSRPLQFFTFARFINTDQTPAATPYFLERHTLPASIKPLVDRQLKPTSPQLTSTKTLSKLYSTRKVSTFKKKLPRSLLDFSCEMDCMNSQPPSCNPSCERIGRPWTPMLHAVSEVPSQNFIGRMAGEVLFYVTRAVLRVDIVQGRRCYESEFGIRESAGRKRGQLIIV